MGRALPQILTSTVPLAQQVRQSAFVGHVFRNINVNRLLSLFFFFKAAMISTGGLRDELRPLARVRGVQLGRLGAGGCSHSPQATLEPIAYISSWATIFFV